MAEEGPRYVWLYCFACERERVVMVEKDWPGTKMVKCGACPAENSIKSIRDAMTLAGIAVEYFAVSVNNGAT